MSRHQHELEDGTVASELGALLDGKSRKSRWLLGGILFTAVAARLLTRRLGLHVSGLQLQFGLAAVWLVVVIVLAYRESSAAKERSDP
jgi:hypothetical protein